jgi:hypothetical protein
MAEYTLIVMTNPVAGREDEYNDWYDNQHVPDVLRVKGFTGAQRFKVADEKSDAPFKYCALYQLETDDIDGVVANLGKVAGTDAMPMSSALDMNLSMTPFRAIGPLVKAK